MKNAVKSAIVTLCVVFALSSCEKDDAEAPAANAAALQGTWKFKSMHAKTNVDATVTSSGMPSVRTVSISDYTTYDNIGQIVIDASKMDVKGMGYSIKSTVTGTYYTGGVLVETISSPFEYTVPASSSSSSYQLVGADSIYFTSSSFISIPGGATQSTQVSGARYTIEGNKLTLFSKGAATQNQTVMGSTVKSTYFAEGTLVFEK